MQDIIFSGFSDEACPGFEEQLKFVSSIGVNFIEVRGVDGKNVAELTEEEAINYKKLLDKYKVGVSSIGSPIGKIDITDDFEPHFELFKNVVRTAKIFGTKNIRMFSFYMKDGEQDKYEGEVFARLNKLLDYAKEQDVILLHENEKGIFGDNAERCLKLMEKLYCDNFKAVFDFANFVQVGQCTLEAWEKLKKYASYIHIKDAVGQKVVPPGYGDGHLKEILGELLASGYNGFLSMEPHLTDFVGFHSLENEDEKTEMLGGELNDGGKFWWKIALTSLKAILYDIAKEQGSC